MAQRYRCVICGYIYDEDAGVPSKGIPSRTRWDELPTAWVCPECGARKQDFVPEDA